MVYDTIYYEPVYSFKLHNFVISDFLIYNDRYVFSNCTEGRVYHWEIIDVEKPTGKPENPVNLDKELFAKTFTHDSSKPYTAFVYDDTMDLFVGCSPEK